MVFVQFYPQDTLTDTQHTPETITKRISVLKWCILSNLIVFNTAYSLTISLDIHLLSI